MLKRLLIAIPFLALYSCVKDKPNTPAPTSVQLSGAKKVYVVNEGNFMNANASVSLYDPGNGAVIDNFYQNQNNSAIGDVAQSLTYFNSNFYLVVNNSNKIIVCDNQFKQKASISGLTSPRYLLPVTYSKAYISDLYSNNLKVVNLNTNVVTTTINCPGWTEEMVLIYNKAFVTNKKRNYVYVINTLTDAITDSINVGPNAGEIEIDKNDKIWVLSAGNATASVAPSLKRIDPITNVVEKSLDFTLTDSPGNLCINKTKDTLYYLNKGIYNFFINGNLSATALVTQGSKNFYGLGVNPNDYTIYASDALDYIQKSNIYIFDVNGTQKTFFKAGINANSFYFE